MDVGALLVLPDNFGVFRSMRSCFGDTGRFSKLLFLDLKLNHRQKVTEVAPINFTCPRGSK